MLVVAAEAAVAVDHAPRLLGAGKDGIKEVWIQRAFSRGHMPNRRLSSEELARANELLASIRVCLRELAGGEVGRVPRLYVPVDAP
jgi:hypothetical protein